MLLSLIPMWVDGSPRSLPGPLRVIFNFVISTITLLKQPSKQFSWLSSPLSQQPRPEAAAKPRALRAQRLHALWRIWRARSTRPSSSTCEAAKPRTSNPTATRSRREADGWQRRRAVAPYIIACTIACIIACTTACIIHTACSHSCGMHMGRGPPRTFFMG